MFRKSTFILALDQRNGAIRTSVITSFRQLQIGIMSGCEIMPARQRVTKRQLGIAIIALTLCAVLGIVGVDFVGAGRWSGFGPLQRVGIGLSVIAIAVGYILVRLGDRPA